MLRTSSTLLFAQWQRHGFHSHLFRELQLAIISQLSGRIFHCAGPTLHFNDNMPRSSLVQQRGQSMRQVMSKESDKDVWVHRTPPLRLQWTSQHANVTETTTICRGSQTIFETLRSTHTNVLSLQRLKGSTMPMT